MTPDFYCFSLRDLLAPFAIQAPDIELQDLVLDSREVVIHKAFLAVAGHQLDGRDFIPQAISLGARVIIADTDDVASHGEMDMREHTLIVSFYQLRNRLADLADVFYGHPTEKLDVVAVTGTNGKTSTAHFCCQLSNAMSANAWYVGTLGSGALNQLQVAKNTTPDAIAMQRIAMQCKRHQGDELVYEASSHALVQGRTARVQTKVAIFTNLSREHLDYHGTMENYGAAKRSLLTQPGLQTMIVNGDDPEHEHWLAAKPASVCAVLISTKEPATSGEHFCFASDVHYSKSGMSFDLKSSWGDCPIETPLFGDFNVYNLLCAIAAQLALGKPFEQVIAATKTLRPVDGRAEFFRHTDKPDIVVDYAHTPDALRHALTSMRHHTQGQLICIFGCGGDRDKGKRAEMGLVAEQLADKVILTNDNVRSESPQEIVSQIKTGMSQPENVQVELDRQKAILLAVASARPSDLIVVAGKGHETSQVIGTENRHYDERLFIQNLYGVAE